MTSPNYLQVNNNTDTTTAAANSSALTDAPPPNCSSWMMVLLSALQNVSNSEYNQEAADSRVLMLDQGYEEEIATYWNTQNTQYLALYPKPNAAQQQQLTLFQTDMSTYGNQADATTQGMQTIVGQDNNNLSQFLSMFNSLSTVTSFTANIIH